MHTDSVIVVKSFLHYLNNRDLYYCWPVARLP